MNWQRIRKDFISQLEEKGKQESFQCKKYKSNIRNTKNILELSGSINCLLYFKIRSEVPYRWGITKTRIEELKNLHKKWFIVLLYETYEKGHLLSYIDVKRSINESLWPLGNERNKNEYKVQPEETLRYSRSFEKFEEFMKLLRNYL